VGIEDATDILDNFSEEQITSLRDFLIGFVQGLLADPEG